MCRRCLAERLLTTLLIFALGVLAACITFPVPTPEPVPLPPGVHERGAEVDTVADPTLRRPAPHDTNTVGAPGTPVLRRSRGPVWQRA